MPRYRDRQTGRVITVEGGEPTDDELDAMFADGGDTFRMRAAQPERTSTVRPIPPGAVPGRGPLGGAEAQLSAGEPEGALSRGYGAVKEAIFGHPDRAEAREAGIGLQPTPAEMAGTAVGLGATGLVGGGLVRGAAALPGMIGRVAGPAAKVATSPGGSAALAGLGTLSGGGSVPDAITNAAMMAVGARALPAGARVARAVAKKAGGAPKVQGPRARPQAVPSAPKQAPKSAPRAEAKPAATAPEKAAEVAPTVLSPGQAASARHRAQVDFAKEIAAKDPKVGEKIWMLLDESGRPVKMLTPDQAGAAARKGQPTTWIRNLWTRPATPARR